MRPLIQITRRASILCGCLSLAALLGELVENVVSGYLDERAQAQKLLNSRCALGSVRLKPIDGEEFFEGLRRREDELVRMDSAQ